MSASQNLKAQVDTLLIERDQFQSQLDQLSQHKDVSFNSEDVIGPRKEEMLLANEENIDTHEVRWSTRNLK